MIHSRLEPFSCPEFGLPLASGASQLLKYNIRRVSDTFRFGPLLLIVCLSLALIMIIYILKSDALFVWPAPCRNAERPERWATRLITMSHCQVTASRMAWVGIVATQCYFSGRHFVRSVLRQWATARANVYTLAKPGLAERSYWPAFIITCNNGQTGLATARPLSHTHFPRFSYLRKWHFTKRCARQNHSLILHLCINHIKKRFGGPGRSWSFL